MIFAAPSVLTYSSWNALCVLFVASYHLDDQRPVLRARPPNHLLPHLVRQLPVEPAVDVGSDCLLDHLDLGHGREHVRRVHPVPRPRRRLEELHYVLDPDPVLGARVEDAGERAVVLEFARPRLDPLLVLHEVYLVQHQRHRLPGLRRLLTVLIALLATDGHQVAVGGRPFRLLSMAPPVRRPVPQSRAPFRPPMGFARRRPRERPDDSEEPRVRALHRVEHEQAHVGLLVRSPRRVHQRRAEPPPPVRLQEAGAVREYHLAAAHAEDAFDVLPGGVDLGRHGGERRAEQRVHQRALPRVGEPRQRHSHDRRVFGLPRRVPRDGAGLRRYYVLRVRHTLSGTGCRVAFAP
ncbi:uncharacterized protein BcabD6B2_07410 [Babesia caballi]|uniref:Uncharacterized protein n=1 Tax=Babesia caballi TaxID=5871 RepID=A0AAV4LMQ8_BABCB|nr:hypothetical protein BcabD6B2_07410 [Babesia caballi]